METTTYFGISELKLIQIGVTVGIVILFFVAKKIAHRSLHKHAQKNSLEVTRMVYMRKLTNFVLIVIFATIISFVWEVSFKGLSVYFSAFFTLVGVAFFAVWSMLSNITASVILFLFFPIKFGSKIKIVDGDNSVTGIVDDISLFSIKIRLDDGEVVSYPNNVAIQKPIKHLKG